MEFSLSSVQTALLDNVKRFCAKHHDLSSRASQLGSAEKLDLVCWKLFGDLGWLGASLPADVEGSGGGAIESAIILEEFGRHLVTEPYWSCAVFSGQLLDRCANARHRLELLQPMIDGRLIASVAHEEADSDGHLTHVGVRACENRGGDGIVITGRKSLVIDGPHADVFIVSARTRGLVRDRHGISLFVVDRNAVGLRRTDYRTLDGRLACDLEFGNVCVEDTALLGSRDSGADAIEFAIDQATVGLCAEAVGIMDAVLWMTRDYLKLRRQYGVSLSTLQALQHRMSDMFVEVELSRSMLYRSLSALGEEDPAARHLAVLAAKIHVCQSGKFVCRNGIQLHGGMGMVDSHMIGQYFKRLSTIVGIVGGVEKQLSRFMELSMADLR